jgi:hypothetical protein
VLATDPAVPNNELKIDPKAYSSNGMPTIDTIKPLNKPLLRPGTAIVRDAT